MAASAGCVPNVLVQYIGVMSPPSKSGQMQLRMTIRLSSSNAIRCYKNSPLPAWAGIGDTASSSEGEVHIQSTEKMEKVPEAEPQSFGMQVSSPVLTKRGCWTIQFTPSVMFPLKGPEW